MFLKSFLFVCAWCFAYTYVSAPCVYSALGDQKKAIGFLEQELLMVESHQVGSGNWNSGPLQGQQVLLTTEPCLQCPSVQVLKRSSEAGVG